MSARARHVDATDPERVRVMVATGRVKDGRTILRMVCSWCDKVIVHGDDDAPVSHGACPRCAREMVAEIAVRSLSELIDAVAVDGRHSPRAVRACRLTTQCIRDIVDVGASENGPDGGASQRAGSDGAVPSGDDTSKVADAPAAGNSGRNGSYVLTMADRFGELGVYHSETFEEMLLDYQALRAKHPGPGVAFSFGNEERADVDTDGITNAELERLQEVLHG